MTFLGYLRPKAPEHTCATAMMFAGGPAVWCAAPAIPGTNYCRQHTPQKDELKEMWGAYQDSDAYIEGLSPELYNQRVTEVVDHRLWDPDNKRPDAVM